MENEKILTYEVKIKLILSLLLILMITAIQIDMNNEKIETKPFNKVDYPTLQETLDSIE